MPVGPALRIASQTVSALGAAAYRSLVHRAINPENLVLVPGQTPQGDWPMVKILQWIGTVPAGSKYAGKNMTSDSTASYLSPEQTREGIVNFQSEIYALGATLWFLLTGSAPASEGPLPRLSGVPKPAMHLLEQMLARDPEQRPHDPVAFEESLRDCLEQVDRREAVGRKLGVPVAVAEPAVIRPMPRRARPWKPLAWAALFLFLATAGAVLLPRVLHSGGWFTDSEQSPPIGVPVGVPESVARAAASSPGGNQAEADTVDVVEEAPVPAPTVVAAANATPPTTVTFASHARDAGRGFRSPNASRSRHRLSCRCAGCYPGNRPRRCGRGSGDAARAADRESGGDLRPACLCRAGNRCERSHSRGRGCGGFGAKTGNRHGGRARRRKSSREPGGKLKWLASPSR